MPHSHAREYEVQENRVLIALPSGECDLFLALLDLLKPPLYILYILHTSRGEGETGRYQSPALEKSEVSALMHEYSDFFCKDSRFDLWFYSPAEKTTLVWDRHNLVYVYGLLAETEKLLSRSTFSRGHPTMNFDHEHNYRQELDVASKNLLAKYNWVYSPLKSSDIQRKTK